MCIDMRSDNRVCSSSSSHCSPVKVNASAHSPAKHSHTLNYKSVFKAAWHRYVHTSDSMGSQTALGVDARAAGSA